MSVLIPCIWNAFLFLFLAQIVLAVKKYLLALTRRFIEKQLLSGKLARKPLQPPVKEQ